MSESEHKDVGTRLREAREAAGLTQTAAAKRLEMRRPSVCEIEAGRRKVSTVELYKFAELYGVSADWLGTGQATELTGKVRLVARALQGLKEQDLEKIERIVRMLRSGEGKE